MAYDKRDKHIETQIGNSSGHEGDKDAERCAIPQDQHSERLQSSSESPSRTCRASCPQ